MKKEGIVVVLILFLMVSFVSANEKISKEIYNKNLNEKIYVKVILKDNNLDNGSKKFLARQDVKTKIASKDILREFKSSRGFSANLTYEEILELSKNPEVSFIGEVRKFKISLSEALPIMNTSSVWETQIRNTNLTGTGQTVCIIDTGINFSHADLAANYLEGYDFVNNDNNPTDDNGHGTHVAGIVAANGAIRGVAPGAKIISIKALDASGSGNDPDIAAGIDWCVDNSSKYNISVISMSLGTDCPGTSCYSSPCDSDLNEATVVNAINRAVANNISVVVASGNGANYTHISSPACASNATPVGDTYDGDTGGWIWGGGVCTDTTTFVDKIVCHANRNSLVSLFAPGAIINSTWFDGGYAEEGGTSMATPMVAGAIALIKQKLVLVEQTKTPSEIEQILNETGKILDDSAHSGLNFSRINILAAIESINYSLLSVEGITPQNDTYTNINETSFNCSALADPNKNLANITFYLWNSSDLVYTNTSNISGEQNSSLWIYNLSLNDNYVWSCTVVENNSQNATSSNYTLTYDTSLVEDFNVSTSVSSSSATLSWNTSEDTNSTISYGTNKSNNSFVKNHSELISGLSASTNYNYNLTFCDRAGNCNSTNGTFTTSAAPVTRSSGGGGGGGGGGGIVPPINSSQMSTGYNKNFFVSEKVNFILNNENHSIQLNKIINNSVNITLRSEPITLILSVGEERKINLSSSDYYDLYIKLENISQSRANITLKTISEKIVVENRFKIQNETSETQENNKIIYEEKQDFSWLITLTVGFVIVVAAFIERKLNQKRLKSKLTLKGYEKTKA